MPYYVMHKILAGLLSHHQLFDDARALRVAVRLAEHLLWRVERLLRRGEAYWDGFRNLEVGGMSEALTDLALATNDSSWLALAARFERPCFIAPLALDYYRRLGTRAGSVEPSSRAVGGTEARGGPSPAARAVERMHGNTHLPQLLGAMARYEATGLTALRGAARAFWEELSARHQYVTGGSTVSETWRGGLTLGDAVSQHGRSSFGAHDVHETCVSHNSMRVSRRLLMWGGDGDDDGTSHVLSHASYYERAMLNAVLGTQRGTLPGSMLYMYPMGGGVSKASYTSGSELHHWGDGSTHWCCQGSGIEAFARLADSVFWATNPSFRARRNSVNSVNSVNHPPVHPAARAAAKPSDGPPSSLAHLFLLQFISCRLEWHAQRVAVELYAEEAGSRPASEPLQAEVRVLPLPRATGADGERGGEGERGGRHSSGQADKWVLWVRIPEWAHGATIMARGRLRLAAAADGASASTPRSVDPGSLVPVWFVREGGAPPSSRAGRSASQPPGATGALKLRWSAAVRWERVADGRERFHRLQAPLWGPLVLAGYTYGERALDTSVRMRPVPASAAGRLLVPN